MDRSRSPDHHSPLQRADEPVPQNPYEALGCAAGKAVDTVRVVLGHTHGLLARQSRGDARSGGIESFRDLGRVVTQLACLADELRHAAQQVLAVRINTLREREDLPPVDVLAREARQISEHVKRRRRADARACDVCADTTKRRANRPSPPLVVLGQGEYRREIHGHDD